MSRRVGLAFLLVLLVGVARGVVDRSGEAARAARKNWCSAHADAFRGKSAVDVETVDERFTDACASASNFRAAFQLARDGRFVFASVTLKKGRLVRGKLERFGLPAANLRPQDWDELRKDTPMALTLVSNDNAPVCLVPPKNRPRTFKAPRNRGFWSVHNPPDYLFGDLPDVVGRLGAHYVACSYEVRVLVKGHPAFALGTVSSGKMMSSREVVEGMRCGLGRAGSVREMLDLYYASTVTYRAIRK